jgi:hypothetical protein
MDEYLQRIEDCFRTALEEHFLEDQKDPEKMAVVGATHETTYYLEFDPYGLTTDMETMRVPLTEYDKESGQKLVHKIFVGSPQSGSPMKAAYPDKMIFNVIADGERLPAAQSHVLKDSLPSHAVYCPGVVPLTGDPATEISMFATTTQQELVNEIDSALQNKGNQHHTSFSVSAWKGPNGEMNAPHCAILLDEALQKTEAFVDDVAKFKTATRGIKSEVVTQMDSDEKELQSVQFPERVFNRMVTAIRSHAKLAKKMDSVIVSASMPGQSQVFRPKPNPQNFDKVVVPVRVIYSQELVV